MSDHSRMIGRNIRIYRRANRMTLEALAAGIHKSKATVGKYEQGSISVDTDTLCEIAASLPALALTLSFLIGDSYNPFLYFRF